MSARASGLSEDGAGISRLGRWIVGSSLSVMASLVSRALSLQGVLSWPLSG